MGSAQYPALHLRHRTLSRCQVGFQERGKPATPASALLALLLYMIIGLNVGEARIKYKVRAPATTGDEHFERAYRVQMNTLIVRPGRECRRL
jgi:hypothetical protein